MNPLAHVWMLPYILPRVNMYIWWQLEYYGLCVESDMKSDQGNNFTTVVAVCICGLAAFNVVTSLQCATNALSSSIIESNVFLAVSISVSFFFPGVNTFVILNTLRL